MNDDFMKRAILLMAILSLSAAVLRAELKKEFPAHWGKPPEIQTMDYVELPDGYGHGSSTLKHWITTHLAKDKSAGNTPPAATVLYRQDFQTVTEGSVPDDFLVLNGEFAVRADGTNKFLELPGAPLDSFAVQFGTAEQENVAASARIFGTARGRRTPAFGVGLGGVAGFKLQVAPAKDAVELLKDQEVKQSVGFDWKSGTWTQLRLQVRKLKEGAWQIEGKAWPAGSAEPKDWTISFDETEAPIPGKASVLASPYAGTPIRFDDLVVEKIGK